MNCGKRLGSCIFCNAGKDGSKTLSTMARRRNER
jgi:hypothetical protein